MREISKLSQEQRMLLMMASRMLDYPDDEVRGVLQEWEVRIDEYIPSLMQQLMMRKALQALLAMRPIDWQETYVETFDYSEKTSLYVTSHELGDSRERGVALLELKYMVEAAGFTQLSAELSDYIPMLFEYCAVVPDGDLDDTLVHRLALVTRQIRSHLEDDHLYAGVFDLLLQFVFGATWGSEDVEDPGYRRESADLEPLPYPLLYQ